jgi:hypothetical protein
VKEIKRAKGLAINTPLIFFLELFNPSSNQTMGWLLNDPRAWQNCSQYVLVVDSCNSCTNEWSNPKEPLQKENKTRYNSVAQQ